MPTSTKPIMVQLPAKLTIALGKYYLGRERQKDYLEVVGWSSSTGNKVELKKGVKWDKEASLKEIDEATPKNMSWQASAGTFWFTTRERKPTSTKSVKYITYVVHGETWPLAKQLKDGENF